MPVSSGHKGCLTQRREYHRRLARHLDGKVWRLPSERDVENGKEEMLRLDKLTD